MTGRQAFREPNDVPPLKVEDADIAPPTAPARHSRADIAAAACLTVSTLLVLADVLAGLHVAALVAVPVLCLYFALCWHRLMLNSKVLFGICLAVAAWAWIGGRAWEIYDGAAGRTAYLPALIAMLSLLRAAASCSQNIATAGRHLVNQPPSRRYLALTFGGHAFGVLFNIGGLALLIDMTKRANTLAAAGGDARIMHWRERRMTTAVLRGFAAVIFWSPLGISLNLLLTLLPDVKWADILPIGLACTVGFVALGWLFDQLQRPPGPRPTARPREPGGWGALAAVVGHIAVLASLTWAAELVTGRPFQTVLLVIVPAYSLLWALGSHLAQRHPSPVVSSASVMLREGIARYPAYANELAVFAASGFLGVSMVALVPREATQAVLAALALPPGVFASLLSLTVVVLAFLGLNPLITSAILAGAAASIHIPGLPNEAILFAIIAGWACTVLTSPMNTSLVMTASMIGRPSFEVGVRWNGAFAATVMCIAIALLVVLLPG